MVVPWRRGSEESFGCEGLRPPPEGDSLCVTEASALSPRSCGHHSRHGDPRCSHSRACGCLSHGTPSWPLTPLCPHAIGRTQQSCWLCRQPRAAASPGTATTSSRGHTHAGLPLVPQPGAEIFQATRNRMRATSQIVQAVSQ